MDALGGGARAALRAAAVAHGGRPDRPPHGARGGRPRPPGRPLGPRQRRGAPEAELAVDAPADAVRSDGLAAGPLAERHGATASPASPGAASSRVEVRERPATPARRPARRRPRRPAGGRGLTGPRPRPSRLVRRRSSERDPTPLLLDGVTGGGKTAIYVEAIAASLARGPRRPRPRPRDRPRDAASSTASGPTSRSGSRSCTRASARASAPTSGGGSGRGGADVVVGTRTALLAPLADVGVIVVDEEHDAAYKSDRTPRFQARDAAIGLAALAGAAVVLGSATPAVESMGRARSGRYRRAVLPSRPTGRAAAGRGRRPAGGARGRQSRAALGRRWRPRSPAWTRPAATGRSSSSTGAARASVVLCRDCGHVQACPDCDRPLVYHRAGDDAPLPPLRPGLAAGVPLSELPLAADPVPRRRHGAGRARGQGAVPGAAGRPPRPGRRRAARAPRTGSSTRSPPAASTCWSGRASSPRASTCPRSRSSAWYRPTSP